MEKLGKVVSSEGELVTYELPAGAVRMRMNLNSRELEFECESGAGGVVEEEYQYNDGEKWVRVTPKKSKGKFKNVPVK